MALNDKEFKNSDQTEENDHEGEECAHEKLTEDQKEAMDIALERRLIEKAKAKKNG